MSKENVIRAGTGRVNISHAILLRQVNRLSLFVMLACPASFFKRRIPDNRLVTAFMFLIAIVITKII
jgi:hypothetical protein